MSPLPPSIHERNLVKGERVGQPGGESTGIWSLPRYPGWLMKVYKPGMQIDDARLDRLIALPATMTAADRLLAERSTSWPASRVINSYGTTGVVIPAAPAQFQARLVLRTGRDQRRLIDVDHLAKSDREIRDRLPDHPSFDRFAVAVSIVEVADLLERHQMVYADWSYANAFWSVSEHRVFIIDMDSCSFGPRSHVKTESFEDPLTPVGRPVDAATDRYRVSLLVARCLTGLRPVADVIAALRQRRTEPWAALVLRNLETTDRGSRFNAGDILTVLRMGPVTVAAAAKPHHVQPDGANVTNWKPVKPRGQATAQAGTASTGQTPTVRTPTVQTPAGQTPRRHVPAGRVPPGQKPARQTPTTTGTGRAAPAGTGSPAGANPTVQQSPRVTPRPVQSSGRSGSNDLDNFATAAVVAVVVFALVGVVVLCDFLASLV